ncbi:hypothetical protein DIZ84_15545, partial [Legionella pneumophila]
HTQGPSPLTARTGQTPERGEREVYALTRVVGKRIADRARTRGCGQERYGGWSAENASGDIDGAAGVLSSCVGGFRTVFWGR